MNKLAFFVIVSGFGFQVVAAPPAPAEKGLAGDGPQVVQNDPEKAAGKTGESETSAPNDDAKAQLDSRIVALEKEINTLQSSLGKLADTQKELEQLRGKFAIVEGENAALTTRMKAMEDDKTAMLNRVKMLEADNATLMEGMEKIAEALGGPESASPKTQTTAKPAYVHSAVRFYNHEGRALRMNVNGVWHTLKEGENDIWVAYGPVHIYRYNGAEPKLFWEWKPYKNGYLMEFDVGTPKETK
jgi:hypothetical protein